MGSLSRESFLTKAKVRVQPERVELPELDGYVFVGGLTAKERDAFESALVEGRGKRRDVNTRNIRAKLVALATVDDEGANVFTEADVVELGECRADLVDRLFSVAQRLSGLRQEDVDELGKPLPDGRPVSSPSGSPATSAG